MQRVYSLIICLAIIFFGALTIRAATVEELQSKSASLSTQIKQLDAEIKAINNKLATTQGQKNTLSAQLKKIETNRQLLLKELAKTDKQITASSLNIQRLAGEIVVKTRDIDKNKSSIREAVRGLNQAEHFGLFATLLSAVKLSDTIAQAEQLNKLQIKLDKNVENLTINKEDLEGKKQDTEEEKKILTGLKNQLSDQKELVDQTKKQTSTLLTQTKNQESAYQKQLSEKLQKKKQVEAEMASVEAQIKIAINPKLLPKTGTSALSWPLSKVIITQYFGNTAFAKSGAYNGQGHNGIDMGTPIGTYVTSAGDGTVTGVGNTDLACAGASYGKWVLIKHTNGLSTLYGHLSLIKVVEGQKVSSGELIAYSGNTGYSTGPHLHLSVYASEGVKVSSLQSKVRGCGVYRLPLASYNSYLNPMSYLPPR